MTTQVRLFPETVKAIAAWKEAQSRNATHGFSTAIRDLSMNATVNLLVQEACAHFAYGPFATPRTLPDTKKRKTDMDQHTSSSR